MSDSGETKRRRRAVCFVTVEVFADAARQLWDDHKPFQILGGTCIAIHHDTAEYLLESFAGQVEEIQFVEVGKLSLEEAGRVRDQRHKKFRKRF